MRKHLYTITLVCLMVLAVWWLSLMPAQAQFVGPGGGGTSGGTGCNTSGSAILKGNGSGGCTNATQGTDYAPATTGTSILKGSGTGGFSNATSGTDYAPATSGTSILKGNNAGGFSNAASGTDYAPATSGTSIQKGNGSGGFSSAVSGTDYAPATSGSAILKGNAAGGFSNAVSGTDYQAPISGNTLAAHNYANSIGTNGAISGAQPAFTDISGTAQVAQGGTGGTSASAATAHNIGAAALGANSDITSLSGLTTPLSQAQGGNATSYGSNGNWNQELNNTSTGTTLNDLVINGAISGSTPTVTIAPAGTTSGILGICTAGCGNSGSATYQSGGIVNCNFDGGVTYKDYVGMSASVAGDCTDVGATQGNGSYVFGQVQNATNASAGLYAIQIGLPTDAVGSGGSGNVTSGAVVGNPATYSATGTVAFTSKVIHAGSGTLAAAFTALGSNPGVVVADPGITYTVSAPLTWGTSNDQILECYGEIECTDTTGGRDCLDVDVHGHLIGEGPGDGGANNGCVLETSTSANITSMVSNASKTAADGFDIRNVTLDPSTASGVTISKGELWLSGAEGFNTVDNVRFTAPPVTAAGNSKIIYAVDDAAGTRQWNQIDNTAVSVTCGAAAGATGISITTTTGGGGSNFTFTGGSVVDCGTTSKLVNISGNTSAEPKNIKFIGTYFEPDGSGDDVDINDAFGVDLDNVRFNQANASTQTNCVHITGTGGNVGRIRVTGIADSSACTNVINDGYYNVTKTTSGPIYYDPEANGANYTATQISLTGTDTESLSPVVQRYLLTANETLTLQQGSVQVATKATTAAPLPVNFEVCQNGTGNFTLAFAVTTGISNLYWSGGSQPGYTLTAGNGDFYQCLYNGTNAYCKETISNVPCL